jgi:hypothetical protein
LTSRASGSRAPALPIAFGSARRAISSADGRDNRPSGLPDGRGDPSGSVVRLVGAGHDTASRVPAHLAGEMPPAAVIVALEAATTDDAGDRREATIADGERSEAALDGNRFRKLHAASLSATGAPVSAIAVTVVLRTGCDLRLRAHRDLPLLLDKRLAQDRAHLVPLNEERVVAFVRRDLAIDGVDAG